LRLLAYLFGVSNLFWDTIIVPIYSSSFLTVHLNYIPAVIVPILNDLIPTATVPVMNSWVTNSSEVFKKLTSKVKVYLDDPVITVKRMKDREIYVSSKKHPSEKFNYIVYACAADKILKSLHSPSLLEYILMYWVGYADDHDKSFMEGIVHSDPSVFPSDYRSALLSRYSNYLELTRPHPNGPISVVNHFILSSWIPAVSSYKETCPMILSYNYQKKISRPAATITNLRAHPDLSFVNLGVGMLLRLCQGYQGTYYCGSYATPGNGHDLSFLSGLVVSGSIGASYPFNHNKEAKEDYGKLARIMGLS